MDAIRKKRKALGWTQAMLAGKVGVGWKSISYLENERNVNYHLLKKVCDVLDLEITLNDLSPIEGKKKEKNTRVQLID